MTVSVRLRIFGKTKQRVSCILCIFGNGKKAIPTLVFKGKPFANLESKLKKHQLVQSGKVMVACQMNTWIDSKTFNI